MTDTPTSTSPSARLHWIQVKLAFGNEGREPARPVTLVDVDGSTVRIRRRDLTERAIEVVEPDRLAEVLASEDLCRLDGEPLLLVNTCYRVLGVATGPATAPRQLKTSLAFAFENDSVTGVFPAGEDQPSFVTLALMGRTKRGHPDVAG